MRKRTYLYATTDQDVLDAINGAKKVLADTKAFGTWLVVILAIQTALAVTQHDEIGAFTGVLFTFLSVAWYRNVRRARDGLGRIQWQEAEGDEQ